MFEILLGTNTKIDISSVINVNSSYPKHWSIFYFPKVNIPTIHTISICTYLENVKPFRVVKLIKKILAILIVVITFIKV